MPHKQRAPRNKTLVLSDDERTLYAARLVPPDTSVWQDKTIHGDLFDALDHLPHSIADLIILDPPYNLDKDFNGYHFKAAGQDQYLAYLRSWFPRIVNLLKPNGSLYLCGDWRSTACLQIVMAEHLTILNRITWQRDKGRGAEHNWKNGMEDIWFGVKDPAKYYFDVDAVKIKRRVMAPYRKDGLPKDWLETSDGNFCLTYPSNFWDDISIPYWSMAENTDHPTQKPEKLIAKLILASCPPGGLVLDPFLGSGTTSVVAKKLGRHYLGIEMNQEYALWAEKRLEIAQTDSAIQGYADGVFWERNTFNNQKKSLGK